jgi:hypothetical protein
VKEHKPVAKKVNIVLKKKEKLLKVSSKALSKKLKLKSMQSKSKQTDKDGEARFICIASKLLVQKLAGKCHCFQLM